MVRFFCRSAPLLLALTMLLWASNSIAGRALVGTVPPMALAFWRWALALALVTPFALPHLKKDWPSLLRHWRLIAALSATGVASFGALLYLGLETTTALNSVLLQSAVPPLILLFAWIGLRERTRVSVIAGVAVSLAGVVVIISEGRPGDLVALRLNSGDALILAGVALYAIYSLLLRFRPDVHALSLLWATFALCVPMLAPFYAWEIAMGRGFALTAPALAGIVYVAALPSFLAYLCFNRGVALIGPARAGPYLHLMPVFGAILSVLLLGEAFRDFHALGIALIGAGIALASARRSPLDERGDQPLE